MTGLAANQLGFARPHRRPFPVRWRGRAVRASSPPPVVGCPPAAPLLGQPCHEDSQGPSAERQAAPTGVLAIRSSTLSPTAPAGANVSVRRGTARLTFTGARLPALQEFGDLDGLFSPSLKPRTDRQLCFFRRHIEAHVVCDKSPPLL